MEPKTVPCETCGRPTTFTGTKRCDLCWNVERNLVEYLESPGGLAVARELLPKLDDWRDGHPDAWDYEAVLRENEVTVDWDDQLTSDGKTFEPAPPDLCGWDFSWKHGAIYIGQTSETNARKAAALFISLWLRNVSASFCDKLMDGYICFLERQEDTSLTFLAETDHYSYGEPFFRLTRQNFCTRESFDGGSTDSPNVLENRIIKALGPVADNEEIVVTFTKRRKS